jgi:hypothetical protein
MNNLLKFLTASLPIAVFCAIAITPGQLSAQPVLPLSATLEALTTAEAAQLQTLRLDVHTTANIVNNSLQIAGDGAAEVLDILREDIAEINLYSSQLQDVQFARIRLESPSAMNIEAATLNTLSSLKFVIILVSFDPSADQLNSIHASGLSEDVHVSYEISIPN